MTIAFFHLLDLPAGSVTILADDIDVDLDELEEISVSLDELEELSVAVEDLETLVAEVEED